jgi:hypothetical protein
MARSPFPRGDFGRSVSPNTPGGAVGAPGAGFAAELGAAARGFGRRLREMSDAAYTREGEADAARAIQASNESGIEPRIRPGRGVDDQAYNTAIRGQLLARRQSAYIEELDKVEIDNGDSEARWAEASAAVRAAFRPTGDATLDLSFERFRTVQDAQALGRVRERQETARRDVVRGAFIETAQTAQAALGQAVASAGVSDDGAALVGLSLSQFAGQLARFGPREAFTLGGVEFAADPSRADIIPAETLARMFGAAESETRFNWIVAAAERAPDAASKAALAGQVQAGWAAGDPMFAGLDGTTMARLTARLEGEAERAATDERAQMTAAGEQAREALRALEYGGAVDPGQIRELAEASGDIGLIAEVDYRLTYGFQVSPREGGGGAGAAGAGFDGWVNVLLDQLEGPGLVGNDNGRGRAQFGITEASHPEAWRDGRIDRTEAAAIYRREYWDAIGGDRLPPELAFAAASAAVVGGVGTARELLQQSGGDVDRFLSLEVARFRRLAAQDPAKYGDDLPGWLNRIGRVRGAVNTMRAQRRAAEGYSTDPIGYARGSGNRAPLATIAEFDPNGVFEGGEGVTAWARAMQSRRAAGRELSRRDGVPERILSDEEARFYTDRLERDPGAVVTLAAAAATALGGDGARQLLGELGRAGLAGADLRLAQMATVPAQANIVRKIVDGRALRANGASNPDFGDETDIAERSRAYAPALAGQPGVLANVVSLAQDMAIADFAAGRLQSADAYLQSALGATTRNGARYGGLSNVNGGVTLAPSWLRADALDEALELAARGWAANEQGPVYANGQPIPPMMVARFRLRAMPNGNYRLVNPNTGADVPARSGAAFEFDIESDRFRDLIGRRIPGAILSGGQ